MTIEQRIARIEAALIKANLLEPEDRDLERILKDKRPGELARYMAANKDTTQLIPATPRRKTK